jgi:hypothetical protein
VKDHVINTIDDSEVEDILKFIESEMEKEKKESEKKGEELKRDNRHRKSYHILNWFFGHVNDLQESKMLACKKCNELFDRTRVFTIPKDITALKYVEHENLSFFESALMASNSRDYAMYDSMVVEDKVSLCCWPLKLIEFAVMHIAHAFHAKHVTCGVVDTRVVSESLMSFTIDTVITTVFIIVCHQEHCALLEIEPRVRKVIIWGNQKIKGGCNAAVQFWRKCILSILQ